MQKKDIFIRLGLLTTALVLSQTAWALGLGRLTVQSSLGQPLNAQIELMGTKEEFSELIAKIAAPSLYQEKDLVYQAVLTRTRATLEYRADGSAFLKIVSSQPVSEPYIDLLIEVNWPAGHALREYTVLLDPPAAGKAEPVMPAQQATVGGRTARAAAARTPPAATPTPTPATTPPPTTAAAPATPATPAAATPQTRRQPTPTPSTTSTTTSTVGENYTVQRGDTLSGIAKAHKTDEITLNQALAALYEANPKAFIGKNMNRLRSGVILQVPSKEEMAATDVREANRVVRVQVAEWRSYLEQVSGQPTPVRPGRGATTAEGAITPTPTVVEGAERGRDQLVVSAGSGQQRGGGRAAGSAADAKAAADAASEERIALQRSLEEEKSRVRDLEETVKKLQRAMELKNQELAQLQQQARLANEGKTPAPLPITEPPKQPVPPAEPPKPPELPVEPPKPPETPVEPPVTPPTTPTEGVVAQVTPESGEAAPPPPRPPRPPRTPPPPPPPEPSIIENIVEVATENWTWLAGAGLLLVGGLGFMAYRRRRAEEVVVDSLFGVTTTSATTTAGTMSPHSSFDSVSGSVNTRSANATASSNSILSEFSREGLGSIDTGEVDPLAEADVYLAYGRAQQAEEILQDALKRGPDRQDVFLKLLEVYADQKKTAEFEATSQQLYALTQGKGEYWQRAAAIGQRLLPGSALFAGVGLLDSEITNTNTATATEPLRVGGKAVDPRGFAPMETKSIAERAADIANRAVEVRGITQPPMKDFTFDMATTPAQDDFGVDLDLEELSRFKNYGKAEERVDIATKPQQPDMEFNLDDFDSAPQIDAEKESVRQAPSLAELDFSENDSIAEDPSPSILEGQWHDAATKLDLARAYQATGDAEACREILQEVLQEGDDQQKAEANAILQSLS